MQKDKNRMIDDLCQRIIERLPGKIFSLQHDLQKTLKEVLVQVLQKCDLVTREEFDTQNRVLQRAQAKLAELEKLVAELEEKNQSDQ